MLLVYTHKITPRLTYIFKHIFVRTLQIPVNFTTKVDEFVAHNGLKMTYSKAPLGSEFYVRSNELLFEQGINDIEINVSVWDEVPCFFPAGEQSSIPFDIFAASFYLISRYEEYLPHVQDEHERFPADESIAYKNKFLEKPVIDIWAYKFLESLKVKFPDYEYKSRTFKQISTVDVDAAFAYTNRGIVRTIGGIINDVLHFRFKNLWNRVLTLLKFKPDPFNTFDRIIRLKKTRKIDTKFFFAVGDYTTFDKNISYRNMKFQSLIKSVSDYAKVGIHPSYFTIGDVEKMKKEKNRLENITNSTITFSRQHYLRVKIPETYQNLIDLDIKEDYTMGYAKYPGFRASTCTPFYFYDLDFEIQTPLKIVPFAFMDTTLKGYMGLSSKESLAKILELKQAVVQVNGTFVSLIHNETLSGINGWEGWRDVYNKLMQ
jgi:hypothetical protein